MPFFELVARLHNLKLARPAKFIFNVYNIMGILKSGV